MSAVPAAVCHDKRAYPSWLPIAALALLALLGWLFMRGGPAGTIDPQLTVANRDGKVTYTGLVRDEATRTAIVNGLQATFGAGNTDGSLRVDPDVKVAGWLPRLGELLAALNVPGAEFSVNGDAINLGGWLSEAQRQALTDALRGIFGAQSTIGALGDAAGDAIRVANEKALAALGTPFTSTTALVQAMNLAIINFATGSAEIPAGAMAVIRSSAEAIKKAPAGAKFEIGGHTDNTGAAAANVTLSQARADAVKNALVAAGVAAGALVTKGYGDSKPRATNDTEYGRFQNRRIEYAVLQ